MSIVISWVIQGTLGEKFMKKPIVESLGRTGYQVLADLLNHDLINHLITQVQGEHLTLNNLFNFIISRNMG